MVDIYEESFRNCVDLLAEDGTIWISIDDNESHYLKVLADTVFGRENFLNEVIGKERFLLLI